MNAILREIIETKKRSLPKILASVEAVDAPRKSFKDALRNQGGTNIIGELKRASPSRGELVKVFDPGSIAREYKEGGACALSVLTDEPYFKGSGDYVNVAKESANLAALCKDFFIDPSQIVWARAIGADAVLLIVRILSAAQFGELYAAAGEAGLDALVETHTENELEFALDAGCEIIGVNCRDLETFETDSRVSLRLADRIPESIVSVAESAIRSREDILPLQQAGYDAFLVGESLMTSANRVLKLRELTGEV